VITFALISLPIFGVVALGWAATRMRVVSLGALDALGAFSFRFALPALVFGLIAGQPLDRSFNPVFYAAYLASGAVVFAFAFGLSWVLDRNTGAAAAGARATTSTVSNLGFLGPPLMLAFFGERGAGPLAMAILAEVMVLLSVGAVIMGVSHRGGGAGSVVLRGTALNPVVAAIALGATLAATGLPLPPPVDRFLGFLGGSAGPTALFALGGALAIQRIGRTRVSTAAAITAAKLIAYPALVWYALAHLLKVEHFWVQAGVLIAALPSAGSNYVLAQRHAADAETVSAAIVLSTLLSVVTVPLAAWLMLG
jgi:malonate transporter and related proteins